MLWLYDFRFTLLIFFPISPHPGISAFLIWNRGLDKRQVKIALGQFVLQLVLNVSLPTSCKIPKFFAKSSLSGAEEHPCLHGDSVVE